MLENGGDADLEISSIALSSEANSGLALVLPPVDRLAPGETMRLGVRFVPTTSDVHSGAIVVETNDVDVPELRIPVVGTALGEDAEEAVLVVRRDSLDYGVVAIGGADELRSVSFGNQGSADLVIASISIEGDDANAFEVVHGGEPRALGAGRADWLAVAFRPATAGPHTAVLRIESDGGVEEVALVGEGEGDANPVFRRGDTDGSGSVELTDAISLLRYLFLGQAAPGCLDAADSDDNGNLELTDAIGVLGYLFLGADAPPAPGPQSCGGDPSEGASLGCESYSSC